MNRIKKIPTSKLVLETVYPGHIEVKTRIGIEEELFLRLTKEFKLPPEIVHKFIATEQEKISARGDDLSKYFFEGKKGLDESLNAFYGGIDHIGRVVSSVNNLNEFTFSEYAYFNGIMSTLWNYYKRRQLAFEKKIKGESENINKMLSSSTLFRDKEIAIEVAERNKDGFIGIRNRESELVGIYQMLGNLCLTKMADCLDTHKSDPKAMLRIMRELIRIFANKRALVSEELKAYKDITNEVYDHDVEILNQHQVSGYTFTKR